MRNSAPIARWRNSQGVLTGLTQEHPAMTRRPEANPFALLLALGFMVAGPFIAAAVMLDGVIGAFWGTAVAAASWRYSLVAGSSPENA